MLVAGSGAQTKTRPNNPIAVINTQKRGPTGIASGASISCLLVTYGAVTTLDEPDTAVSVGNPIESGAVAL